MSQGPKVNKNYLYPCAADQPSPSSNPLMNNTFPASSPIVNAPARQYNQDFPHPPMNRQSSSAYPHTHVAYSTSAYNSTGNVSAPQYSQNFPYSSSNSRRSSKYSPSFASSTFASNPAGNSSVEDVLPATTYFSSAQKTHHRESGSSSRHSQASCFSDTCSQPSLPSTPRPFDERPTQKWLSQMQCDIPVRSTAQDTKRDSRESRNREVSGRSDGSTSGLSPPAPTSVGSSSLNKGRPRENGLYVVDYHRLKRRHPVSRETRKKETAERQAVARLSAGRQTAKSPAADGEREKIETPEPWEEWQTKGKHGGWI
ncbi:uncharacterized protein EAE97_004999 [Botrytis byssoidea]|uniref:Uncharacterized protein n=1 Tax=Botrytis byssoidea TaxID=139641 RepID=A0A9P5IT07_9HELO|nr:uncharacterized protein EAE97_004999 [Botrytis byssoidea]KAF7945961.1 hypothetical protein EAE97_004999 [Botrytis byssoidea]